MNKRNIKQNSAHFNTTLFPTLYMTMITLNLRIYACPTLLATAVTSSHTSRDLPIRQNVTYDAFAITFYGAHKTDRICIRKKSYYLGPPRSPTLCSQHLMKLSSSYYHNIPPLAVMLKPVAEYVRDWSNLWDFRTHAFPDAWTLVLRYILDLQSCIGFVGKFGQLGKKFGRSRMSLHLETCKYFWGWILSKKLIDAWKHVYVQGTELRFIWDGNITSEIYVMGKLQGHVLFL